MIEVHAIAERALPLRPSRRAAEGLEYVRARSAPRSNCKSQAARRPYPFASDPVGEVAEQDLAGDAEQANHAQRPGGQARTETDVQKILGLVNLHRIPGVQSAEIAQRQPPEPRGPERPRQGPVDSRPFRIDDIGDRPHRRAGRDVAVRLKPNSSGRLPQQQIDRRQHDQ